MTENDFNLLTEPWIKVINNKDSQETMISLSELFENTSSYRELAGEMRSQDLAIFRFLLSILTTVYSRFDANGETYDWIQLDEGNWTAGFDEDEADISHANDKLLETWDSLYQKGAFTKTVIDYLYKQEDKFNLFGKRPFYQVTSQEFDSLVPAEKRIATGKGTIAIKQINRLISESNNSPSICSPKTGSSKNVVSLDELARWLITYQNYTGVTDKTKVKREASVSDGWLYSINPVFAKGSNLFESLMLNLVLSVKEEKDKEGEEIIQCPVWEFSSVIDYVHKHLDGEAPTNIAELYTIWSRILHIEWNGETPTIFSAGLPKISGTNAFIEPMTTWRVDKKTSDYKPFSKSVGSLGENMWRNFGQYVNTIDNSDDKSIPGVVRWLKKLKDEDILNDDFLIDLETVGLIKDGNATSQSPVAEVNDSMRIEAAVLFDSDMVKYWPARIEDTIKTTKKVASVFKHFVEQAGELRGLSGKGLEGFSHALSARFYFELNHPFKKWLSSLRADQERDKKINEWKKTLRELVINSATRVLQAASPKEIIGQRSDDRKVENIFVLYNNLQRSINQELKLSKRSDHGR